LDTLVTTPVPGEDTGRPIRKAARLAMAVLWTLVILILCWMPGDWVQEVEGGSPWFQIPDLDKVIHWGIFVAFTVLWLRTSTSRWRYLWVALAGLAVAVVTEVVQELPAIGRDGEVGDAITDLIGVAIGLGLARWIEPLNARLESLILRISGEVR
jgi:hypothetical protein